MWWIKIDKKKYDEISLKLFGLSEELKQETIRIDKGLEFLDLLDEDGFKKTIKTKIEKIKKDLEDTMALLWFYQLFSRNPKFWIYRYLLPFSILLLVGL